jgi:Arc/MetJ-type ribon-helix-helix transcriptional regulator
MTRRKERVTVTVDAELVTAGNRAVKLGRAESLSAWINDALLEREAKERRLKAMTEAVAAYEAEFGKISAAEMAAQKRADDRAAVLVRGARQRSAHASARRSRSG